jgi:hypothetical protein
VAFRSNRNATEGVPYSVTPTAAKLNGAQFHAHAVGLDLCQAGFPRCHQQSDQREQWGQGMTTSGKSVE